MSFRQSWSSGLDYPLQYISAFSQQSVRLKLHQGERKKNKPNTEIYSIRISSLFQVDSMRLRVKKSAQSLLYPYTYRILSTPLTPMPEQLATFLIAAVYLWHVFLPTVLRMWCCCRSWDKNNIVCTWKMWLV